MRIAVVGAQGQLGTDVVAALDGAAVPLGHGDVEITDIESVRAVVGVGEGRFDRVVNCAAYNLVDRAEDEPDRAFAVNALGPRNLAIVCAEVDVPLLHVSTDYVFGLDPHRDAPYTEADAAGPVSAYGVSKLAGEQFVRSVQPRSFVVRTCGLYGYAATVAKGNFVESMLRLGRERDRLTIVDDQVCTPTATVDVARAIAGLVTTESFGTYHATNTGATTWFAFARAIFAIAGIDVETVPITSAEFGARARRPGYSVLDSSKLAGVLGGPLRPWRAALEAYFSTRPA